MEDLRRHKREIQKREKKHGRRLLGARRAYNRALRGALRGGDMEYHLEGGAPGQGAEWAIFSSFFDENGTLNFRTPDSSQFEKTFFLQPKDSSSAPATFLDSHRTTAIQSLQKRNGVSNPDKIQFRAKRKLEEILTPGEKWSKEMTVTLTFGTGKDAELTLPSQQGKGHIIRSRVTYLKLNESTLSVTVDHKPFRFKTRMLGYKSVLTSRTTYRFKTSDTYTINNWRYAEAKFLLLQEPLPPFQCVMVDTTVRTNPPLPIKELVTEGERSYVEPYARRMNLFTARFIPSPADPRTCKLNTHRNRVIDTLEYIPQLQTTKSLYLPDIDKLVSGIGTLSIPFPYCDTMVKKVVTDKDVKDAYEAAKLAEAMEMRKRRSGDALVDCRIEVMGKGEGTVVGTIKSTGQSTMHKVRFNDGIEEIFLLSKAPGGIGSEFILVGEEEEEKPYYYTAHILYIGWLGQDRQRFINQLKKELGLGEDLDLVEHLKVHLKVQNPENTTYWMWKKEDLDSMPAISERIKRISEILKYQFRNGIRSDVTITHAHVTMPSQGTMPSHGRIDISTQPMQVQWWTGSEWTDAQNVDTQKWGMSSVTLTGFHDSDFQPTDSTTEYTIPECAKDHSPLGMVCKDHHEDPYFFIYPTSIQAWQLDADGGLTCNHITPVDAANITSYNPNTDTLVDIVNNSFIQGCFAILALSEDETSTSHWKTLWHTLHTLLWRKQPPPPPPPLPNLQQAKQFLETGQVHDMQIDTQAQHLLRAMDSVLRLLEACKKQTTVTEKWSHVTDELQKFLKNEPQVKTMIASYEEIQELLNDIITSYNDNIQELLNDMTGERITIHGVGKPFTISWKTGGEGKLFTISRETGTARAAAPAAEEEARRKAEEEARRKSAEAQDDEDYE